jgi:pimeloyl-ACP methyl ester carboxylesterase
MKGETRMKTDTLKLTAAHAETGASTPLLEVETVIDAAPQTGYAQVNGLNMYYEIHGARHAPGLVPLVMLHGSMGSLDMFRELMPTFAKTRQVIAIDQQAHGRTADVDRPLSYEQMADDTAALVRHLGIAPSGHPADFFGFSMGGGIALQLAIRYPDLVRKLVVNASYGDDAIYPEVMASLETYFTPQAFAGSPMEAEYKRVAPKPDDFPALVLKVQQLTREAVGLPAEAVRAIAAPTMIIAGDSDIVRPENAVELFRLRGGGVPGDFVGHTPAQLAVLPGTTHIEIIQRTDWLQSMVLAFLDAPVP